MNSISIGVLWAQGMRFSMRALSNESGARGVIWIRSMRRDAVEWDRLSNEAYGNISRVEFAIHLKTDDPCRAGELDDAGAR